MFVQTFFIIQSWDFQTKAQSYADSSYDGKKTLIT
jgi:hypothetical protein